MKIAHIVNNFDKTYDGIGAYAKVMYDNLPKGVEEVVYSAECCESKNELNYIFNFEMTKEIFRCVKNFSVDNADAFLIEYPFKEWNPIVLVPIYYLYFKCKRYKKALIISLHEYGRTHRLRKIMCRQLCKVADHVFTTTDDIKNDIFKFSKNVSLRNLPSNIWNDEIMKQDIKKNYDSFAFFGLVNSAKAFSEMMSAWDIINAERKYRLYILSGSFLENIENRHVGVTYIYNAESDTVLKTLRQCAYCFIPIKPEIDSKNASFNTATVAGCICIGKFCAQMSSLPFVVPMNDYQVSGFVTAVESLSELTHNEVDEKTSLSYEYGKQFCPSDAFGEIINTISEIVQAKGKDNDN